MFNYLIDMIIPAKELLMVIRSIFSTEVGISLLSHKIIEFSSFVTDICLSR